MFDPLVSTMTIVTSRLNKHMLFWQEIWRQRYLAAHNGVIAYLRFPGCAMSVNGSGTLWTINSSKMFILLQSSKESFVFRVLSRQMDHLKHEQNDRNRSHYCSRNRNAPLQSHRRLREKLAGTMERQRAWQRKEKFFCRYSCVDGCRRLARDADHCRRSRFNRN